MSTGGDRERDGRTSPRPRYMAMMQGAGDRRQASVNGHRRRAGSATTMTILPGARRPHVLSPVAGRLSPGTRGPVWAGMVALAVCIVAATLLLWAGIAGVVWIVWRLAGG